MSRSAYQLSGQGREKIEAYRQQIFTLNNANPTDGSFSVQPAIQQVMHRKIQESNAFLSQINVRIVPRDSGQKIGLSTMKPIMKRTNTKLHDRVPVDPLSLDDNEWKAYKQEFDTYLPWETIDAWSFMPEFEQLAQQSRLETLGNNIMMVGFNGVSADTETDPAVDQLLSNVNIGWLQRLRLDRPEQVVDDNTGDPSKKLYYGPNQEFKTIDALVQGAINGLLPNWAKNVPMTALCGHEVTEGKNLEYINRVQPSSEEKASQDLSKANLIANRPAYNVPFFPSGTILLTPLNNLSYYEQAGSIRRIMHSNPKRDREEDYQTSNAAFVVEDNDFALLLENVEYTTQS